MKIQALFAMIALGLCASSLANAAPPSRSTMNEMGFFVGAQASRVTYKEGSFDAAHPTALSVMGGWRLNQYFDVEGRLGFGVASDTINAVGVPVDLKLRSYFSLLARGTLPVSDAFNVYAVGGRTRADFSASAGGSSVSGTDADWAYGVGIEFLMGASHESGISIEGGRLLSAKTYDADIVSIGFRHNF